MSKPNADAVLVEIMSIEAVVNITRGVMGGDVVDELARRVANAREAIGPLTAGDLHDGIAVLLRAVEEVRTKAGALPEHEAMPLLDRVAGLSDDVEELSQLLFKKGRA